MTFEIIDEAGNIHGPFSSHGEACKDHGCRLDRNEDISGRSYKDPTCAKCGIVLGNRMSYCCQQSHCPAGLN